MDQQFEETRFRRTLERGLSILDAESRDLREGDKLSGETAFTLYDTYGFPLDLTQDALKARGIEVIDRVIMPNELINATQVFLTGTAAEVTPVGQIDNHTFSVGDITRWMMDDYDKKVGKVLADGLRSPSVRSAKTS